MAVNWATQDSGIEMLTKEKHPFIKGRKKIEVEVEEDEQNDQSITKIYIVGEACE